MGMTHCRGVSTPFSPEDHKGDAKGGHQKDDDQEKLLTPIEASRYRRCTAIVVYMGQDRPDLSMAACHLARGMASPRQSDFVRLKRVAWYIKAHPRLVVKFEFQPETQELVLMTDSDWANDARSRKSHSGGVIKLGGHLISHWSRIQPVIALSSGEAELYSGVTGMSRFLGLVHLARDLRGNDWGSLSHHVDAAACKGMLMRRGVGGVKHIETKHLWIQEAIMQKSINVVKIPRDKNLADALASYSSGPVLSSQLEHMGCYRI